MADVDVNGFLGLARTRRSVREFEPGRRLRREELLAICEAGRWAPSGANTQPWHFVVVDDPAMIAKVTQVFVRQTERLYANVPKFPHVHGKFLANTMAIIVVCGDPRYQAAYPQSEASPELKREYAENSYRIWLVGLGAAVQNIQLAIAAAGLTSAWLSGGGEDHTAAELRTLLKIPSALLPVATVPIGAPRRQAKSRWRAPLDSLLSWNTFERSKLKTHGDIRFYIDELRAHAMYRGSESMEAWPDYAEIAEKLPSLKRSALRKSARKRSAPA